MPSWFSQSNSKLSIKFQVQVIIIEKGVDVVRGI